MSIIPYDPAEIVKIKVGDLSAPVAAGTEMSKLYLVADKIVDLLVKTIKIDEEADELIIPPELLPWAKEQRALLSEIHKMTGEVEQKVYLEKVQLASKLVAEHFKTLTAPEQIIFLKELKKDKKNGNREHIK